MAIGNRWYRWLCERAGLDPVAHYAVLTECHQAPRLQPPFNEQARLQAGFSAEELARLRRLLPRLSPMTARLAQRRFGAYWATPGCLEGVECNNT